MQSTVKKVKTFLIRKPPFFFSAQHSESCVVCIPDEYLYLKNKIKQILIKNSEKKKTSHKLKIYKIIFMITGSIALAI